MTTTIFNTTRHLCLLFVALAAMLTGCNNDADNQLSDIQFNLEGTDSVALNKQSTRIVLLNGGTGKYVANIANSRIASISVSKDTLRINGLLEGDTYATILSGDFKRQLKISVVVPPISISDTEIRLYPRDESKFVSLAGGGDLARLAIDDPDSILTTKWNAKTGILEIAAAYEGEAYIKAIAQDGKYKTLKVNVRCSGSAQQVGVYGTTSRSIYPQMNTVMAVSRPGVGVWLINGARPTAAKRVLKIKPNIVSPKVGQQIMVSLGMNYPDEFSGTMLREGKHKLTVEEVRAQNVVLRGRGFKLVVPYEQ